MFKIGYDKKITMVQGDTGVIRMRISNYELSQGDEVRFAIVNKANPSILLCQHSDKKIVLEKQVTVFEKDGSARIVIYPYDTEYLQPGKYLYEIQVKTKDGRIDTVVPLTSFTLMDGSIQGEFGQTTPSKPEPTPSEIELRFKRLENEVIPELGNRITNVENEIDSVNSSLDNKTNLTNKHIEILNSKDDTKGVLELANFAGQGVLSNIIAFILHHYTDSGMIQLDNVGSGTILTLKNAQNASRRPDKDRSYVGNGNFLELYEHDNTSGYAKKIMIITKDGEFLFTGEKGTTTLSSNMSDNGYYAFDLKTYKNKEYLLKLTNGDKGQIFSIRSSATNTRLDFETNTNQTNGMRIKTNAGSLDFVSGATGNEDMLLKGKRIRVSNNNGSSYYNVQTTEYGTTANRPTFTVVGQRYFDTDLNKPIWRNKDNNGWVDSNGNGV